MFRGPRGRLAMPTELPSLNKEITYLLTYLLSEAQGLEFPLFELLSPHYYRPSMVFIVLFKYGESVSRMKRSGLPTDFKQATVLLSLTDLLERLK